MNHSIIAMKIKEYKILSAPSSTQLATEVNAHIAAGYEPFGPLVILTSSGVGANPYYQPVVKYEYQETN